MEVDYITLAVPAFFVLIALELWVTHRRGHAYYRLNDSLNDLATGVLQQLVGVAHAPPGRGGGRQQQLPVHL